ncbi:binding-protein-dependent transport protein [Bordetella pertussis]|nr:binding-protein-dependent transport protein [Bordetella pertussis]
MIAFAPRTLAVASIAATVALAGCGQKEEQAAAGATPLRIGIIESVTGPAASYGDAHNKGTRLAVEEINKAGGFNGVPLEVHGEDDKSDPATSINAAKKLITQRKVDAIVGSAASLVTIAFSKENEKYKVPLVNGMAGSPIITEQGFQYTWRIKITDNQLDTKAIEHYVQNKNARKVAFLAENSDYGKPPTKAAADRARELGAEVVAYEEYNRGETDFKAQLTNIRDRAPDVLFVHGYYTEGSIIARQIRELGLKTAAHRQRGPGRAQVPGAGWRRGRGRRVPHHLAAGPERRALQAVRDRLPGTLQQPCPARSTPVSYEAVYTVVEAARKGGGTKPEQIQAGLAQLQGFETLLGPVRFDKKNQNDGSIRLARFNNGKIEPLQ